MKTHQALRNVNTQLLSSRTFGHVDVQGLDLVPVDIDVSPLDNSDSCKERSSGVKSFDYGFKESLPCALAHL
ncbi:MAG: hypothetical protein GKR87_11780 [Kiritimatiellae bacterium]|nr:hypothetical protein [Kiritimatiellia bacterium]